MALTVDVSNPRAVLLFSLLSRETGGTADLVTIGRRFPKHLLFLIFLRLVILASQDTSFHFVKLLETQPQWQNRLPSASVALLVITFTSSERLVGKEILVLFGVGGSGDGAQDQEPARQVFYHQAITPALGRNISFIK